MVLSCTTVTASAQENYRIPVSEAHEQMQKGQYEPTWQSLEPSQRYDLEGPKAGIYFDVTVLPFYPLSDCGLKIVTHMYNKNPRSVVFGKILSESQRKALTWDVERGAPNEIISEPWQTCNCIGGWHYNTSIYERNGYKSAAQMVKQLVDIVSKNGNLLLSIPLRADGTYDEAQNR